MKRIAIDKEKAMLNSHVLRKTIDQLRRPFVQRLITLVLSTLLAMSMGTTILLALPQSEREVAMTPPPGQCSHHPSPLSAERRAMHNQMGSTLNATTMQPHQDGINSTERRPS